jgi:hypothetical protein
VIEPTVSIIVQTRSQYKIRKWSALVLLASLTALIAVASPKSAIMFSDARAF